MNSFSSFAFKFNITFFVTRESGSQDSQVGDNPIELPRRSWRLFQPKSQDQDFEEHKELIIEALQFSFTIYGRDEYRWIGYAFVSSNAEENDREDENQDGGESEDETGQEDSDNDEGEESPFTKDPISLDTQDAEYIRNPRKCFLDVVDIWLLTCFNYFKDTVRELEYSISNNVSQMRCPLFPY